MKKQRGYNLIELMIALALGLIVIGSTIALYIGTIRGSSNTVKAARLNHDLEAVMTLMVNDIRRAGYWGGAMVGSDSNNNPFTSETGDMTNIKVRNFAAPTTDVTSGNCILYSYDADGDRTVDTDERYGFRLRNGTINMRLTGAAADPATCASNTDSWEENIAGNEILITDLTFDLTNSQCKNVTTNSTFASPCTEVAAGNLNTGDQIAETRQVDISLSGQLVNDPTVTKTLNHIVKVRNDRVFTQP